MNNKQYNILLIFKKLKLRLKKTIIDKTLTSASETWIPTKRDRKQINIFERKVYRRILSPVYDNEKNWRILNNKEIYAMVKKPTVTETISNIYYDCQTQQCFLLTYYFINYRMS